MIGYQTLSTDCVCLDPEGGAVGQSAEHRRRTVEELRAVFRATGLPFLTVPLEQVSVALTTWSNPLLHVTSCKHTCPYNMSSV